MNSARTIQLTTQSTIITGPIQTQARCAVRFTLPPSWPVAGRFRLQDVLAISPRCSLFSMVRAVSRPGQPLVPDIGWVPWPERHRPSISGVS